MQHQFDFKSFDREEHHYFILGFEMIVLVFSPRSLLVLRNLPTGSEKKKDLAFHIL